MFKRFCTWWLDTRDYLFSPDEDSCYIVSTQNSCCGILYLIVFFFKISLYLITSIWFLALILPLKSIDGIKTGCCYLKFKSCFIIYYEKTLHVYDLYNIPKNSPIQNEWYLSHLIIMSYRKAS